MELLIVIAPMLIVGAVGYFIILIQEWISDVRFYRRKTREELDRIRRSFGKVTLPTGEVEVLGSNILDKQKTGTVTSRNEELDEAERLIKEARDRIVS